MAVAAAVACSVYEAPSSTFTGNSITSASSKYCPSRTIENGSDGFHDGSLPFKPMP